MTIDIQSPGMKEADLSAALQALVGFKVHPLSLTSDQLNHLHSAPVEIVPAPGAGKIAIPLKLITCEKFNSVQYQMVCLTSWPTPDSVYIRETEDYTSVHDFTAITFDTVDKVNQPITLSTDADQIDFGVIATASVGDGGSGYSIGDTGSIEAGGFDAAYEVTSVDGGGAVTGFALSAPGTGYQAGAGQPTSVNTGSGDGAFTIDVDSITPGDGTALIYSLYAVVTVP
jgi:hypothetical protein